VLRYSEVSLALRFPVVALALDNVNFDSCRPCRCFLVMAVTRLLVVQLHGFANCERHFFRDCE
jgi:hypothetical protein